MWQARTEALTYLRHLHPLKIAVIDDTFMLFDACIDAYKNSESQETYCRVCATSLVKAKNFALGAYSLILDGLGQEAGALIRPMIEYTELLTYFGRFPEKVQLAIDNRLPKAGERAKEIKSVYQQFRRHLNQEASHSSFSDHAIAHVFENNTGRIRKFQKMVPHILERNLRDFIVQLHLLLHEAIFSLEQVKSQDLLELAERCAGLQSTMFNEFKLDRT